MASHVVGVPTSGVAWDDDSGGAPALAVPVGSNPAYHARSMSLKRESQQQGETASALSRRRVSRKVAPEGDEQQMANTRVGVSEAFLEDFLTRVLPQFGLTREALSTPKTREEWLQRLSPKEDVRRVDVDKAENGEVLFDLGDGLQARKSDVEHVRKLVRQPRCRNKDWELVEAEVDLTKLPEKIDTDTPLHVRVKGDPKVEWMTFLAARDVALVQTSDIVDFVVKPITQWKDGRLLNEQDRNTYVDHVADVHPKGRDWVERNYFGKADIFVSHAWMDAYQDFSDAMTSGCSDGSKHYQNKLANQILGCIHSPTEDALDGYFRSWKNDSAARWQRWSALFVTSLILSPSNLFGILLKFSGIIFIFRTLPVSFLKWTMSVLQAIGLVDPNRRWVDIFCKNQWVVNSGDTQAELEDGVGNVDKLWLVTHSWKSPQALKRAWCQFELRAARLKKVDIVGIACAVENENLRAFCRVVLNKSWFWYSVINPFESCCSSALTLSEKTDGFQDLQDSLDSIDARTAQARFDSDKKMILDRIQEGVEDESIKGADELQHSRGGDTAIDAHNDDLRESYLDLISKMMNGYVGGKVQSFLVMNAGYCIPSAILVPIFIAESLRELAIWLFTIGIASFFILAMLYLALLMQEQIKQYYIQPLLYRRRDGNQRKIAMMNNSVNYAYYKISFYISIVCAIFLCALMGSILRTISLEFNGCASHPLASEPLVPSCSFVASTSTAPRDLREFKYHVIGSYYRMPNKTINGKHVFEAFANDESIFPGTRKVIMLLCFKRYLYYTDTDKWIVGDSEDMEIGKSSGWIFSNTKYADSPAWLPADERWELYYDGESHYGAVQLTCRNLPAAPPPPPPPPISTPACTFALRDDAPSAVKDADHVLGTYYLMSNKTVNDRPVFELNRNRYLYYDENENWIVGNSKDMEIGKGTGWIFSNTKYADSPAWLPADERWRLYYDGESYYGALELTCRHLPAAPPPPPPPNSS